MLDAAVKNNDCMFIKDLKISGKDLISFGAKPGKEMGEILKTILASVIKNPKLNTYENLKAEAEKYIN